MDRVNKILLAALLLALLGVAGYGIAVEREILTALGERKALVETLSDKDAIRDVAEKGISVIHDDVVAELSATRKGILKIADRGESDVAAILERRGVVLDSQVENVGEASVTFIKSGNELVDRGSAVMAQVQTTSDILLDCEGNPDCLANRVIGTTQAVEGFADAGRDAMVELKAATPEILEDADKVSSSLVIMADKGAEASAESAAAMKNIRKQTEPMPMALRLAGKFALPIFALLVKAIF